MKVSKKWLIIALFTLMVIFIWSEVDKNPIETNDLDLGYLLKSKDFSSLEKLLAYDSLGTIENYEFPLRELSSHDDLIKVAGQGYIHSLKLLIQELDINYLNHDSFTPLMMAARNGFYQCVKILLEAGADVDKPDEDGLTPLRYAVLFEHLDVAKYLLKHSANVDVRDRYLWTPLLSAVANNNTKLTKLLLQYNANPQLKTSRGEYALIKAIYHQNHEIVNLLIQNGADVNVKDMRYNYPAIFWAVETGKRDLVKPFLENQDDLDIQGDKFGETVLMRAVTLGFKDIVQDLITAGANLKITDHSGRDAVSYAVELENIELENVLRNLGVSNENESQN